MMFPLHRFFLKITLVTTSLLFAGSGLDIILNKTSSNNQLQISAISDGIRLPTSQNEKGEFPRKALPPKPLTQTHWKAELGTPDDAVSGWVQKLPAVTVAQAQGYNEQKIENYAQAVIAIEKLRQNTFGQIQSVLNSQNVPNVACNRSASYQNLPSDARSLIINYCNRSKEIVQNQGLTVSEFNQITETMESNPQLKQKVQQQMLQAQ